MLNNETPPSLMSSAGFGGYVAGGGSAIVPLGRGSTIEQSKDKEPVISSNFLLSLSHDLLETQTAHVEEKSISYQQVCIFSRSTAQFFGPQVLRVMRRQRSRSRASLLVQSF